MNSQQALSICTTIARAKGSGFQFIDLDVAVDSAVVYFDTDLRNPVTALSWFAKADCMTDGIIGRVMRNGEWAYFVRFWLKAMEAEL